MVLIDASKYDIFPDNLDNITFYDVLDYPKTLPKTLPWWLKLYHLFKPPIYVRRIPKIINHPHIYWDGHWLKSNQSQINVRYNPDDITKSKVIEFMEGLGGFKIAALC